MVHDEKFQVRGRCRFTVVGQFVSDSCCCRSNIFLRLGWAGGIVVAGLPRLFASAVAYPACFQKSI